jgi:hypothetical protein
MLNISGFFELENGNPELKSDLKHVHINTTTTVQTCKSSIIALWVEFSLCVDCS